MICTNKPVWSEGLFIKPTHFQQQDRYHENQQKELLFSLQPFAWGFTHLEVDQEKLALGKVAITSAKGILPDGSHFSLPHGSPAPSPLTIDDNLLNEAIYLCLPAKSFNREVSAQADGKDPSGGIFRYQQQQVEIQDVTSDAAKNNYVPVAKLNFKLMKESDKRNDYLCLGIAHVLEKTKNQQVKLNQAYIPPFICVHSWASLQGYVEDIAGLLENQVESISNRITASGTGGAAEVEDVMKLQLFNRNLPLFRHLSELPGLHPEYLYQCLVQLTGEMASFSGSRICPPLASYQHTSLSETFDPIIMLLKDLLTKETDPRAVNLPLKEPRYGIYRAIIHEKALLETSHFIIAIKADAPLEDLRQALPGQVRIASIETILDLIRDQMSGLPIRALPVAPRQLPFHQGFVYFEIDKNNHNWEALKQSSGFGFHISGNYTGLELEFWAIKAD